MAASAWLVDTLRASDLLDRIRSDHLHGTLSGLVAWRRDDPACL